MSFYRSGLAGHIVLLALTSLFPLAVLAQRVVVEGQAQIQGGDVGQAREVAMRRALGLAANSGVVTINSRTTSSIGELEDTTRVDATACTRDASILDEKIQEETLTLTVAVNLTDDRDCPVRCQGSYTNKILATGFAIEFPQQLGRNENSGLVFATPVELARKLKQQSRVQVAYDETFFPYASPALAPNPYLVQSDEQLPLVKLAKAMRSQYVVSGIYRNLSVQPRWLGGRSRTIELDAYIHDGIHGALLAQRRFSAKAIGEVELKKSSAIGSAEFYVGDFGQVWGQLLENVAQWTADTAACLPFTARVLKVERGQIYLDAGAESGIAAGDVMRQHVWRVPAVRDETGLLLGQEKQLRSPVKIKVVYPGFSIAEFTEAGFDLKASPGDLLYLR